jgi:hypothetical protein
MAFRSVSQQGFHGYGPSHGLTMDRLTEEQEWFADADGDVIGVIANGPTWVITAFGHDAHGDFLACDATTVFANVDEGRRALFAQMESVGVTPRPARATFHNAHIRQRLIADRLLAASLSPLEVSLPGEHDVPRVVFKRGTEFVTITGVGDTVDEARQTS